MWGNNQSVLLANISQLLPASVMAGKDALSPAYKITELSEDSRHFKGESSHWTITAGSIFFGMLSDDNALVKVAVAEVEDGRRRG